MQPPAIHHDVRTAPAAEQVQLARNVFNHLGTSESAEFIASMPFYGFCIGLLEGGHKFSWEHLEENVWRVIARKAPYPSLNGVVGAHHPALLPLGRTICVTDRKESVWLVDGDNYRVSGKVRVGGAASHLATHPEGRLVYVACPETSEVAVVDMFKKEKIAAIPVGRGGHLANFSPDGRHAVINCSGDDIYFMDTQRHVVVYSRKVGQGPHDATFSPDGQFICAPCASGDLYLIPVDAPDRAKAVPCGFGGGHMDFSGDSRYAYVANSLDNDVSVIDLTRQERVTRIPAGAGAHQPALSADGRLLFVANFVDDTITVANTVDCAVVATIPVGTYPHDVVRAPDGQMVVSSYGSGSCTIINPAELEMKTELKTGEGTSHCTFLPDRQQAFFANSLSGDMAVVEMDRPKLRARIPGLSPSAGTLR